MSPQAWLATMILIILFWIAVCAPVGVVTSVWGH